MYGNDCVIPVKLMLAWHVLYTRVFVDAVEYNVVFTPSATGSLKLVGETFPWTPESEFRCETFR
jgi:hypothetical protein